MAESELSIEAQCAANEEGIKSYSVPIFGLSGSAFEAEGGSHSVPGPLFWHQTHRSFRLSLEDGGLDRLHFATSGPGMRACPDQQVTFMRVAGMHGAGIAGIPPSSPKTSKVRLTYRCSQSKSAAKDKRGHDGVRSDVPAERRALLPSSDCQAKFVVALRNTDSRTMRCTICDAFVKFHESADPDPEPYPTAKVDGKCPWAGHNDASGHHVVRSGLRVVNACTAHSGHWPRTPRLDHRVLHTVGQEIVRLRVSHGTPTAVLSSIMASKTQGQLSSGEMNSVLQRFKGKKTDTGVSGLLEHLRRRGDVAYLVRWRVVRLEFVADNYAVAGSDGDLNVLYELYCPSVPDSHEGGSFWDATKAMEAGDCSWSVALSLFRSFQTPEGVDEFAPLAGFTVPEGYTLNAAAIYWQTREQTVEAMRCPYVSVTDTACKTNSSVMEYGAFMVKNALGLSCQQGHYLLNGLSRANYCFAFHARRLFMGVVAQATEYRSTDGDRQLMAAASLDGMSGLCRCHTVNFSMREMCNKNGLTGAERDVAADVKDRVHFIFRTCETEAELIAAHRELCDHIDSEQVPKGPTRRRRTMARKEGCTDARRTPAPGDKRSRSVRFTIARFVSYSTGDVEVLWDGFHKTTKEPVANLLKDLGPTVFDAYCRAAGIDINDLDQVRQLVSE